ncbi:MAG: hypothetical protein AAGD34_12840 [Pseudomonadota bacterium]
MTKRRFMAALSAVAIPCLGLMGGANLAAAEPAPTVADGAAWSMTNQNGRTGTLILNPDGTGTIKAGPITIGTSWWAQQTDGLCLANSRMGTRCVTLVKRTGGYDGVSNGETVLKLRR